VVGCIYNKRIQNYANVNKGLNIETLKILDFTSSPKGLSSFRDEVKKKENPVFQVSIFNPLLASIVLLVNYSNQGRMMLISGSLLTLGFALYWKFCLEAEA